MDHPAPINADTSGTDAWRARIVAKLTYQVGKTPAAASDRDWFVATDKRFLLFYGFIRRRVAMMPLLKVTDMTYDRSILGRILGYGNFVLESAGQDQALSNIDHVPDADTHYRAICTQLFGPGSLLRIAPGQVPPPQQPPQPPPPARPRPSRRKPQPVHPPPVAAPCPRAAVLRSPRAASPLHPLSPSAP